MSVRSKVVVICLLVFFLCLFAKWYWLLLLVSPIFLIVLYDVIQTKHTLLSIYPLVGHIRYLLESIRPEIQQYFVETNISGRPINREFRELVYQRAKKEQDTRPFGTQFDVYRSGYEWISHSLAPIHIENKDPRVLFGGEDCENPYLASIFNISAMSYGALSKSAIMALNKGAQLGNFAHNTGEGGISPHHLKYGGDLIWQIGTGYFGCRDDNGVFNEEKFIKKSHFPTVKMIEIKLSQGAKPGHGGILPAAKLTQEIADIRHVPLGKDVISPASHSAFNSPSTLLTFVKKLKTLSGKPVGFKLCIGNKSEFLSICKAMLETGITPDFITIDGSEGGTGASPIEFANSVGMPLTEAVVFVNNALIGCGLRSKIKLIAAAKIFSAFHVARILALGADTVNSARGMMLALGCIQSRSCNTDKCPTGIATQDPKRYKFLDIDVKGTRVFNFHKATLVNLTELLGACGLHSQNELMLSHIYRRIDTATITTYEKIYPLVPTACLLNNEIIPEDFKDDWLKAHANTW